MIINAPGEDKEAADALRAIIVLATAPENPMDEREALLRITCINLKLRIAFVNRWKANPPMIRIGGDTAPATVSESNTGRVEQREGFKLIPLNISDEHRKQLGL